MMNFEFSFAAISHLAIPLAVNTAPTQSVYTLFEEGGNTLWTSTMGRFLDLASPRRPGLSGCFGAYTVVLLIPSN